MQTFTLNRQIPVEDGYDLLVAGGGPAGTAAAIAAARMGARVVLVEAMGCLGGVGTSGALCVFDTMADGEKMICGGLMAEYMDILKFRGYIDDYYPASWWSREVNRYTPYDTEGLKLIYDELAVKAGVEIRFFTRVIDADVDENRRVRGVVTANMEGYRCIRAKAYIDATGDGLLAGLCGAAFQPPGDRGAMPPTLCALFANIDWNSLDMAGMGIRGQQQRVEQAIADGYFSQNDRHVPGLFRYMPGRGIMNAGHIFGMDAMNCRSLSEGMIRGRQLVQEYGGFFRKYFENLRDMQLIATGSLLGVRESRRIAGEYVLNYGDYTARRHFPDQIAVYTKAIDIHVHDCSEQEYRRFDQEMRVTDKYGPGESYGIPYGALVPRGFPNLWVAGRCASADEKVHGSLRVQPAAVMMGQAAACAAVLCGRENRSACDCDTAHLVEELRSQGAYLPQPELTPRMTRE